MSSSSGSSPPQSASSRDDAVSERDQADLEKPSASGLAARLRQEILDGRVAPGEYLPSEWELVEQTGLTRTGVREALSQLKRDGLIETRRGRQGGSAVIRPRPESLVESLHIFLQAQTIEGDDSTLLEAREAIEPWAAALAAQRRTPEEIDELDRLTDRMEDAAELRTYLDANLAWHAGVARASHNGILLAFMRALSRAMLTQTGAEEYDTPSIRGGAIRAHRLVNEAIRQGDAPLAQRRMGRHVHAFTTTVESLREPTGAVRVD